jgi:hypothetical protein
MNVNQNNNGCNYISQVLNNPDIKVIENWEGKISKEFFKLQKNIVVSLFPLDFFIHSFKNRISVIKIDVEGYEVNILLGAKEIIKKHKPFLIIEITNDTIKEIAKIIETYNYECIKILSKEIGPPDYLFRHKDFISNLIST